MERNFIENPRMGTTKALLRSYRLHSANSLDDDGKEKE